jgi:alditol oxidase
VERNWAGNYIYGAERWHRPASTDELQEIVARAEQLRVVGSRHSFTDIADAPDVVSLERLPVEIALDAAGQTVTVSGNVRYGELAEELGRHGLALANLASLPHISVAGAIATATHGSGNRNGNLATSVTGLEFLTSLGEMRRAHRGETDFDGLVVGLGAAGVVTRVTLEVEPAYEVTQHVYESMEWDTLLAHLDEVFAAGYSVSVFSRWGERVEQVWVKRRVDDASAPAPADRWLGAPAATVDRHPIFGLDPVHATPQLGVGGQWSERLPHFRLGFTPSNGDEVQSEYLLPRSRAPDAIEAMLRLSKVIGPLTQVGELRTVAADSLWMSTAYGRDLLAIHFTWVPDVAAVTEALEQVEAALLPLDARPHWGKVFNARADTIAPRYPRLEDFRAVLDRVDPRGAFRNEWLERRVLGEGPRRACP